MPCCGDTAPDTPMTLTDGPLRQALRERLAEKTQQLKGMTAKFRDVT